MTSTDTISTDTTDKPRMYWSKTRDQETCWIVEGNVRAIIFGVDDEGGGGRLWTGLWFSEDSDNGRARSLRARYKTSEAAQAAIEQIERGRGVRRGADSPLLAPLDDDDVMLKGRR